MSQSSSNKKFARRKDIFKQECCICISPLSGDVFVTRCMHVFHYECLEKWLDEKESCPFCREEFLKDNPRTSWENEFNLYPHDDDDCSDDYGYNVYIYNETDREDEHESIEYICKIANENSEDEEKDTNLIVDENNSTKNVCIDE